MLTEGPLRTRRSLAPSHLNSQWAESTACYAGAFNLACHACTNTWLPLRLRYAGGSAPEGMGRRVQLRRTGEEKEKKERTRGEARGGEEKPD